MLLHSDIARLVLGYLAQENCVQSFNCFLNESHHLSTVRHLLVQGTSSPYISTLTIFGKTLCHILDEYNVMKETEANYLKSKNGDLSHSRRLVHMWEKFEESITTLRSYQIASMVDCHSHKTNARCAPCQNVAIPASSSVTAMSPGELKRNNKKVKRKVLKSVTLSCATTSQNVPSTTAGTSPASAAIAAATTTSLTCTTCTTSASAVPTATSTSSSTSSATQRETSLESNRRKKSRTAPKRLSAVQRREPHRSEEPASDPSSRLLKNMTQNEVSTMAVVGATIMSQMKKCAQTESSNKTEPSLNDSSVIDAEKMKHNEESIANLTLESLLESETTQQDSSEFAKELEVLLGLAADSDIPTVEASCADTSQPSLPASVTINEPNVTIDEPNITIHQPNVTILEPACSMTRNTMCESQNPRDHLLSIPDSVAAMETVTMDTRQESSTSSEVFVAKTLPVEISADSCDGFINALHSDEPGRVTFDESANPDCSIKEANDESADSTALKTASNTNAEQQSCVQGSNTVANTSNQVLASSTATGSVACSPGTPVVHQPDNSSVEASTQPRDAETSAEAKVSDAQPVSTDNVEEIAPDNDSVSKPGPSETNRRDTRNPIPKLKGKTPRRSLFKGNKAKSGSTDAVPLTECRVSLPDIMLLPVSKDVALSSGDLGSISNGGFFHLGKKRAASPSASKRRQPDEVSPARTDSPISGEPPQHSRAVRVDELETDEDVGERHDKTIHTIGNDVADDVVTTLVETQEASKVSSSAKETSSVKNSQIVVDDVIVIDDDDDDVMSESSITVSDTMRNSPNKMEALKPVTSSSSLRNDKLNKSPGKNRNLFDDLFGSSPAKCTRSRTPVKKKDFARKSTKKGSSKKPRQKMSKIKFVSGRKKAQDRKAAKLAAATEKLVNHVERDDKKGQNLKESDDDDKIPKNKLTLVDVPSSPDDPLAVLTAVNLQSINHVTPKKGSSAHISPRKLTTRYGLRSIDSDLTIDSGSQPDKIISTDRERARSTDVMSTDVTELTQASKRSSSPATVDIATNPSVPPSNSDVDPPSSSNVVDVPDINNGIQIISNVTPAVATDDENIATHKTPQKKTVTSPDGDPTLVQSNQESLDRPCITISPTHQPSSRSSPTPNSGGSGCVASDPGIKTNITRHAVNISGKMTLPTSGLLVLSDDDSMDMSRILSRLVEQVKKSDSSTKDNVPSSSSGNGSAENVPNAPTSSANTSNDQGHLEMTSSTEKGLAAQRPVTDVTSCVGPNNVRAAVAVGSECSEETGTDGEVPETSSVTESGHSDKTEVTAMGARQLPVSSVPPDQSFNLKDSNQPIPAVNPDQQANRVCASAGESWAVKAGDIGRESSESLEKQLLSDSALPSEVPACASPATLEPDIAFGSFQPVSSAPIHVSAVDIVSSSCPKLHSTASVDSDIFMSSLCSKEITGENLTLLLNETSLTQVMSAAQEAAAKERTPVVDLCTPGKTVSPKQRFSTISHSSGIFSVLGDEEATRSPAPAPHKDASTPESLQKWLNTPNAEIDQFTPIQPTIRRNLTFVTETPVVTPIAVKFSSPINELVVPRYSFKRRSKSDISTLNSQSFDLENKRLFSTKLPKLLPKPPVHSGHKISAVEVKPMMMKSIAPQGAVKRALEVQNAVQTSDSPLQPIAPQVPPAGPSATVCSSVMPTSANQRVSTVVSSNHNQISSTTQQTISANQTTTPESLTNTILEDIVTSHNGPAPDTSTTAEENSRAGRRKSARLKKKHQNYLYSEQYYEDAKQYATKSSDVYDVRANVTAPDSLLPAPVAQDAPSPDSSVTSQPFHFSSQTPEPALNVELGYLSETDEEAVAKNLEKDKTWSLDGEKSKINMKSPKITKKKKKPSRSVSKDGKPLKDVAKGQRLVQSDRKKHERPKKKINKSAEKAKKDEGSNPLKAKRHLVARRPRSNDADIRTMASRASEDDNVVLRYLNAEEERRSSSEERSLRIVESSQEEKSPPIEEKVVKKTRKRKADDTSGNERKRQKKLLRTMHAINQLSSDDLAAVLNQIHSISALDHDRGLDVKAETTSANTTPVKTKPVDPIKPDTLVGVPETNKSRGSRADRDVTDSDDTAMRNPGSLSANTVHVSSSEEPSSTEGSHLGSSLTSATQAQSELDESIANLTSILDKSRDSIVASSPHQPDVVGAGHSASSVPKRNDRAHQDTNKRYSSASSLPPSIEGSRKTLAKKGHRTGQDSSGGKPSSRSSNTSGSSKVHTGRGQGHSAAMRNIPHRSSVENSHRSRDRKSKNAKHPSNKTSKGEKRFEFDVDRAAPINDPDPASSDVITGDSFMPPPKRVLSSRSSNSATSLSSPSRESSLLRHTSDSRPPSMLSPCSSEVSMVTENVEKMRQRDAKRLKRRISLTRIPVSPSKLGESPLHLRTPSPVVLCKDSPRTVAMVAESLIELSRSNDANSSSQPLVTSGPSADGVLSFPETRNVTNIKSRETFDATNSIVLASRDQHVEPLAARTPENDENSGLKKSKPDSRQHPGLETPRKDRDVSVKQGNSPGIVSSGSRSKEKRKKKKMSLENLDISKFLSKIKYD